MLLFPLFYFLKSALSLKLRTLKLCKLWSVCTTVSDETGENHTEPDRTASLWIDIPT